LPKITSSMEMSRAELLKVGARGGATTSRKIAGEKSAESNGILESPGEKQKGASGCWGWVKVLPTRRKEGESRPKEDRRERLMRGERLRKQGKKRTESRVSAKREKENLNSPGCLVLFVEIGKNHRNHKNGL